jgi:hypothetical protein
VELLRFAGSRREEELEAKRAAEKLTSREIEVLQALAEGLGSEQIATRLHISLRTERNHMANILQAGGPLPVAGAGFRCALRRGRDLIRESTRKEVTQVYGIGFYPPMMPTAATSPQPAVGR